MKQTKPNLQNGAHQQRLNQQSHWWAQGVLYWFCMGKQVIGIFFCFQNAWFD